MRIALPRAMAPAAFAKRDLAARILDLGGETMGTRWTVRLAAPAGLDARVLEAAIVARLAGLVAEMSQWEADSILSRFNRAPSGAWSALPPDFAHVVAEGLAIAEASNGTFDPAIGRSVDLHGFGAIAVTRAPTADELAAAHAASGRHRLVFDPAARRLRQPGGLALDLSGIAKGHAVDVVADLLAARGIGHALVEVGGELVGRGVRPDGEPWWVDLEEPPGAALPPLRIALHGLAVATSGDYRRGRHTLDPRTGRPADTAIVSASVIHETALAADAWATALTVQGAQAGMTIAQTRGLAARLIEHTASGYREWLSPALEAMLAD